MTGHDVSRQGAAAQPRNGSQGPFIFGMFFVGGLAIYLAMGCMLAALAVLWLLLFSGQSANEVSNISVMILFAAGSMVGVLQPIPQFLSALGAYLVFSTCGRVRLRHILWQIPIVGISAAAWLSTRPFLGLQTPEDWVIAILAFSALQVPVAIACWWMTRNVRRAAVEQAASA